MEKSKKGSFGRRGFLKGAAAGAAAFVAGPVAGAQQAPPAQSARAVGIVPPAGAVAAETEVAPPSVDVLTQGRPGADLWPIAINEAPHTRKRIPERELKIPISILRCWHEAWAFTAKDRFPIRKTWGRPCGAPSREWSAAKWLCLML